MDRAFLDFTRDGQRRTIAMDSSRFTLGRASGNDLGFPEDATVSGHHAVIEQQADGWLIRDLNSTNGTIVNGQRISGPQPLGSGDSILLGQAPLAFRIGRPERSQAPLPSSEYFDNTEEWEPAVTPSVPAQQADPAPDWTTQEPQQPPPGSGQASPGAQRDVVPDSGMSRVRGGAARSRPTMRGRGRVRGTARGVNVRRVGNETSILSFRIERYDASGDRLPPVGVELFGFRGGQLSDGEEVEVFGRWSHGTLQATEIINLTTGAQVRGVSGSARRAVGVAFALIFAAVIVGTIVFIIFFVKALP